MAVGIDSTILYETLSRGTRVIFFNIRPSDSILRINRFFGWPKKFNRKGPFWTDQLSQREVNFLLNKVKNLTKTPIVAIGGINFNNYKKLLLNNANLLAISGYVWNNKKYKPTESIKRLK